MKPVRLAFIAALALTMLAAACTEEAKKPNEDSVIAMELMDLVNGLKEAYSDKNFSGMSRYCTDEVYSKLKAGLKRFDTVDLVLTPRWIELNREGDYAEMLVGWKGRWKAGDKTVEKEGIVFFAFGGKPFTITRVERLSPFAQP